MSERTDNIRYYLNSTKIGKVLIEEIKDFSSIDGDKSSLDDFGHFKTSKVGKSVFYQIGHEYLLEAIIAHGPELEVKLITEVKDDTSMTEDWKVVSDPSIDLYSLEFNEENDTKSVSCKMIHGGDLKKIEASFDDEYDTVGEDAPALDFVTLKIAPRAIPKTSRFIGHEANAGEVNFADDDAGSTARAVLLELDRTEESQFIGEVSNSLANSRNDWYASLDSAGNTMITNAPFEKEYTISGIIDIIVTEARGGGDFRMDLVRYINGESRNFGEVIRPLGTLNPGSGGARLNHDFEDFKFTVYEGDSIGIMTLSDTSGRRSRKYKATTLTDFTLSTETPFPSTKTKAVKPFDMFRHMARMITEDHEYNLVSSVFGEGARHENKLLVHGTWLRNMPEILNEGDDDERRVQANLTLEDLYEGYSILEPLRYDVVGEARGKAFSVGAFKDIQQNFTGIRLGETREGFFKFFDVFKKKRTVLGDNYFRKVRIGSETSGSNYGEVNNLYSTAGYTEWATPNRGGTGEYVVVTDFRTGAEDIELQRQFQYSDNPDIDGEYDNDWFLVDAEIDHASGEYVVKKWQRYYATAPKGVFSVDTNFNWPFIPIELLRGHGYKVNVGLKAVNSLYLTNPAGNCDTSITVNIEGLGEIHANKPFAIVHLDAPRIKPMLVECESPLNQELVDQLRGETDGVDNKFGLIEFMYDGELLRGRIFEADTSKGKAKFKIIQAT